MVYQEGNLRNERDDHTAQKEQQERNDHPKGMEGEGMGGHNFGRDGKATPIGDDKDNPSRNAGYTNPYFARNAPLEEDTANNNFKAAYQQGEPDIDKAQPNVPGPQEVPDQQKVGEGNQQETQQQEQYHEPELDEQQPDHGSGSTETGQDIDHIET